MAEPKCVRPIRNAPAQPAPPLLTLYHHPIPQTLPFRHNSNISTFSSKPNHHQTPLLKYLLLRLLKTTHISQLPTPYTSQSTISRDLVFSLIQIFPPPTFHIYRPRFWFGQPKFPITYFYWHPQVARIPLGSWFPYVC